MRHLRTYLTFITEKRIKQQQNSKKERKTPALLVLDSQGNVPQNPEPFFIL